MNKFLLIKLLRVEFLHYFPSNPIEYVAFREDFLDFFIISRSRNIYSSFIDVLLCSPAMYTVNSLGLMSVFFGGGRWGG
jgi:hypothetical protein